MATAAARLGLGRAHADVPINLLPRDIRAAHRLRQVFNGVLGAAGLIVVILATMTFFQHRALNQAKHELADQKARAAQLTTQVTALAPFGAMETQLVSTRRTLAGALFGDVAWSRFMTDLSRTVPGDSWIGSLSMSAKPGVSPAGVPSLGTARYTGSVLTFPGLAGWLTSMQKLSGLNFVYLNSGTKGTVGTTPVVTFTAQADLTPQMLSGRCQTENSSCP
jgi:Tfp pilus assembly protein PilN